jgi:hypothetical protein
MTLGKKITEIVDKVINVSVPYGSRILSNSRQIFKPTKNSIRARGLDSSWSMTDKEINPSPEGADLNLQRFKRGKQHNKTQKKMNCSPLVEGKTPFEETCYTVPVLMQIRDEFNRNHEGSKKITSNDPKVVWQSLRDNLVHCEKEDCWLKELKDSKLIKQIDTHIFAPDSPPEWKDNPNEWLSNFDILNVLSQYQRKHKEFRFLGPSPIDFDAKIKDYNYQCVERDICNLSLQKQMKDKKTKIGIVFNLDKHDESGSHWVSLFIDLENKFIFYFNSTGDVIPKEIKALVKRLTDEGKRMLPHLKLRYYDSKGVGHQRNDTECGMYSLFFIITMLTGDTEHNNDMTVAQKIKLFKGGRIPDKKMEYFRSVYFNLAE